jgi:outer membrane protein TolC
MKKLSLLTLVPLYLFSGDLGELVDNSLNNQLVKASKYNVEASENLLQSTKSAYLPKLSIGGNYSNTNKETASTPNSSTTAYATLSYVVYDGGKRGSSIDSLESNIKSSKESLNALKNNISLEVVTYYFNYQSLLAKKEATLKEIETLNAQQKRLQQFLEAGTTTSDEVDKIISRVESANVSLHQIELELQTLLHNLEYITANKVTIDSGSTIANIDNLKVELRSDLKVLKNNIDSSLHNARASKSGNYPTITLNNTYTNYNLDYDNSAYDSNLKNQNIFRVNFSWNIFDFNSVSKTYESNYKQYEGLKSQYEYEKNKANIDLKLASKSYDISKLKIKSAKAALRAANSTYETIEAKYNNGLVDNVQYLEALSEKYSAQSALKSAQYDIEIAKAKIIYYSGKNIWEYIK